MYELLTQNGSNLYLPLPVDEITWQTARKGEPGRLDFKIIDSPSLKISEGNAVRLKAKGENIFFGFVFKIRRDKSNIINITAYDQMRYLKNKDTYVYTNKTASEVIEMLAKDFNLRTGQLEDTGFKIESRVEDNQTLFDIIQNALDLTLQSKKEIYVLYDDFGKLTLKNLKNMRVNILLDENTGENFDYTSTIDGQTYNQIKLVRENEQTGKREIYITKDSRHINEWGVLQFSDTINEKTNGKAKADALLSLYNRKTKNLTLKNCFGDIRVRAGSLIAVSLDLGDMRLNNLMLAEKCKHIFKENEHYMDLSLRGGDFVV